MMNMFNPFFDSSEETIDTTIYGTKVNVSMNSINDDHVITVNLINENGDTLSS